LQFVRKALDTYEDPEVRTFYLVESRDGPSGDQRFRQTLGDDETFETDFVGASAQECQSWALDMQSRHNFIERDLIAIADVRSASDDTLSMHFYSGEPLEYEPYGLLPRSSNTWYEFRIDHKGADKLYTSLNFGMFEFVFPVYFGRKEELTDENGIFDVERAERICATGDPEAPGVE
jgi:hypothetical protein